MTQSSRARESAKAGGDEGTSPCCSDKLRRPWRPSRTCQRHVRLDRAPAELATAETCRRHRPHVIPARCRPSEHVLADVVVAHQVGEARADVLGVHLDGRVGEVLGAEGDLLEHLLEDGEEPARADVLVLLVDGVRLAGDLGDPVGARSAARRPRCRAARCTAWSARSTAPPGCARGRPSRGCSARRGWGSGPASPG